MTIDRAREIVTMLARGIETHPPILQKEANQAFAVCLNAATVEPTARDMLASLHQAMETRGLRP